MADRSVFSTQTVLRDATAGLVVFLVALPLCLGVALASSAPLFSGLLGGVVGGIVIGMVSQSQTSVSGPSPAMTAIVAALIAQLGGSFEAFLLAVVVAGLILIVMGVCKAGALAAFVPSGVIKGLIAAIGIIIILKQIPHLLGHDSDPEGEMSFIQPDDENTFSELIVMLSDVQLGAAAIGLFSLLLLLVWDRMPRLKKTGIPPALLTIVLAVGLNLFFRRLGGRWLIEASHLVQVPVAESFIDLLSFLKFPDFSVWSNPAIYFGGLSIAIVSALETLLNVEAVDKLDPKKRVSPPNRELVAQGVGCLVAGCIGGLPTSSVIVRSSVNLNAGAETKLAAIFHGVLFLVCVALLPNVLNLIPLSCLAAILVVTGMRLANASLFRQMWSEGKYQFAPFAITLLAIVFTSLITGILIGLGVSIAFVLYNNLRRPVNLVVEKHLSGEILHLELPNQVSFLNRAALSQTLDKIPPGGHVLFDARNTSYIDPDILSLLREFKEKTAPVRGITISMRGFRQKYQFEDVIRYVDYSTRELQGQLTPQQVLQILVDGNDRFRTGRRLTRDLGRQMLATAHGQHPIAVILSCIDSRSPAELIFDLGLGDIFSVRVAGNVVSPKVLGSIEYACAVAGAKLVLVLGHTRCGAVTAAVQFAMSGADPVQATGCENLGAIVHDIQHSMDPSLLNRCSCLKGQEHEKCVDDVARNNVAWSVTQLLEQSSTLRSLNESARINVLGAMYDISSGQIEFFDSLPHAPSAQPSVIATD